MARIKLQGRGAVYHCMSRVVGGQALLSAVGREKLVGILRQMAGFCGLEVITYCVMSNHFHVLVRVPEGAAPGDGQLLARMEGLYGKKGMWVQVARQGMARQGRIDADVRRRMLERMGDVSGYMKEVKQRFSRWYNGQAGRYGTLWAERFKSVLVEDQAGAVATVAAYIDLNPVRAGLVADPKDYRFCGYAAALAGDRWARAGLLRLEAGWEWGQWAAEYRQRLFVGGGEGGGSGKVELDPEAIKAVLARGGQLSLGQILRLRIRHMTDGVVLGSKGFVDEVFGLHREKFGSKRQSGARVIRGAPLGGLMALRDLRVRAVT